MNCDFYLYFLCCGCLLMLPPAPSSAVQNIAVANGTATLASAYILVNFDPVLEIDRNSNISKYIVLVKQDNVTVTQVSAAAGSTPTGDSSEASGGGIVNTPRVDRISVVSILRVLSVISKARESTSFSHPANIIHSMEEMYYAHV